MNGPERFGDVEDIRLRPHKHDLLSNMQRPQTYGNNCCSFRAKVA